MQTHTEIVKSRDLFEGAYLLCRGFHLKGITVTGSNGRKIATFELTGRGIKRADEEYRAGRSTVNVAMLRFSLENLKEEMWRKIRQSDR